MKGKTGEATGFQSKEFKDVALLRSEEENRSKQKGEAGARLRRAHAHHCCHDLHLKRASNQTEGEGAEETGRRTCGLNAGSGKWSYRSNSGGKVTL